MNGALSSLIFGYVVIYNNLLFFLSAIVLFSMATVPPEPVALVWWTFPALILIFISFDRYARLVFQKPSTHRAAGYFRAEKKLSVTALLVYSLLVFALDLKSLLNFLSFGELFPAFVNIAGLIVFIFLLVIIWRRAKVSYEIVFARSYSSKAFILSNVKANLSIVIPWIILSLCYDLFDILQWSWLQNLINSDWGNVLFFALFLVFVFVLFPPIVRRLWGCKPLGEGALKDHLVDFCERQNFSANIYLWPLFEGRVITAGVMGVIPGLRYILLTPALIETMTLDELDSVMVHEIGHVKWFHLLLYVLLIGGFLFVSSVLAEPLFFTFFTQDYYFSLVEFSGFSPEAVRNVIITIPVLLSLLLYFRYVFGYFMRNFERQADLHVFAVLGNSKAIVSAFEKIALLSGNIRDQPSWHHFGIGQRIDYLLQCEHDPVWIERQHKKVKLSLLILILFLSSLFLGLQQFSFDEEKQIYEVKSTRANLLYNARQEDTPGQWLFFAGNYLVQHRLEKRAIIAYELAMEREPNQPELLNNFARLLLTCKEDALRDPLRALTLSRNAALLQHQGHILDTYALALWSNGFVENAIQTEKQALLVDPQKSAYYQSQLERFNKTSYLDESKKDRLGNQEVMMSFPGRTEGNALFWST